MLRERRFFFFSRRHKRIVAAWKKKREEEDKVKKREEEAAKFSTKQLTAIVVGVALTTIAKRGGGEKHIHTKAECEREKERKSDHKEKLHSQEYFSRPLASFFFILAYCPEE